MQPLRRRSHHRDTTPLLLTVDESVGCLWATRGLAAGGFAPWVAVSDDNTYAGRSRAAAGVVRVPSPDVDPVAFVDAVAEAAERCGAAAVLPATEPTLLALSGRETRLPPGVAAGTASADALDRATDKALLTDLAAEAGIAAPPAVEVDAATPPAVLASLTYPVVLKPRRSVTATPDGSLRPLSVVTATDANEVRSILADGLPRLAQRRVQGELQAVAGVAWRGETVCTFRQRSPRIWPLPNGITAFAEALPPGSELEGGVRRLVRSVGWSGIFDVQFLHNEEGDFLIDFNPRVYGSIGLAISAGLNLPAVWASVVLGREPEVGVYRPGTSYRVEAHDVRALLADWRGGRRVATLRGVLPRRGTVHGVWSVHDPWPASLLLRRLARGLRRRPGVAFRGGSDGSVARG